MLDVFARLFASVAGLLAVALGIQLAPISRPATTERASLDSLDVAEGLQATLVAIPSCHATMSSSYARQAR